MVGGAKIASCADGLRKLVEDRAEFAEDTPIDPAELRAEVFAEARARVAGGRARATFDRARVLAGVAEARGLTADDIERGLYADLRAAHVMKDFRKISPVRLVEAYELAQPQAVLLRAVKVVVEVEDAAPGAYRALFHKLKFLRLLCAITPRDKGGYRIEIDGPFSLFESVTRYGLSLALALPAIRELDRWSLDADLRWGTAREKLRFHLDGRAIGERDEASLSDELTMLMAGLAEVETPWRAKPATTLLNLPGVGVCAPDLVFEHQTTGEVVYLEVMGYWSRAAVWRRVELVQRGLGERIVFAVGQQLRVSEEALDEELPGALYVYKRTMAAKAILARVEAVAAATIAVAPAEAGPRAGEAREGREGPQGPQGRRAGEAREIRQAPRVKCEQPARMRGAILAACALPCSCSSSPRWGSRPAPAPARSRGPTRASPIAWSSWSAATPAASPPASSSWPRMARR